jgi:hypothetical protein
VILKPLQICLQSPECQFGKGPVNARRLQPRYATFLFGDHSLRFFYTVRYCAQKIIICRHVSGPAVFAYFIEVFDPGPTRSSLFLCSATPLRNRNITAEIQI